MPNKLHYSVVSETNKSYKRTVEPEELTQLHLPSAVRRESSATSYVDAEGFTYLIPNTEHDFDGLGELIRLGLSSGVHAFDDLDRPAGVVYPPWVDMVTLPAIINSSLLVESGEDDVTMALKITGDMLENMARVRLIPRHLVVDDIAIDRLSGAGELLPPYILGGDQNPEELLDGVVREALGRIVVKGQAELLKNCYQSAVKLLDWAPRD